MRLLAGIIVVLPLVLGAGAPRPQSDYPSVEECPFSVDPNLVEGRLLGWVRIEVGKSLTHTRTWYDPDGDEAMVEIVKGPPHARIVNRPKVGSYTILWTPREPGTVAIVLRVTDKPRTGLPKSDTGTILVQVRPRGKHPAPRLCGGPPQ